jgi:hypothetical protein
MSVSTVFLNKAIFRIHKFKFPATLVAGQMAFTLLAVVVLQQMGVVRRFHFSLPHFRRVSHLPIPLRAFPNLRRSTAAWALELPRAWPCGPPRESLGVSNADNHRRATMHLSVQASALVPIRPNPQRRVCATL